MLKKKVYVIDVGKSVDLLHPLWKDFLKRDIHNTITFFSNYIQINCIEEAEETLFNAITEMTLTKEEFLDIFVEK